MARDPLQESTRQRPRDLSSRRKLKGRGQESQADGAARPEESQTRVDVVQLWPGLPAGGAWTLPLRPRSRLLLQGWPEGLSHWGARARQLWGGYNKLGVARVETCFTPGLLKLPWAWASPGNLPAGSC